MVCLHRDGEFSFANEVHEGLLLLKLVLFVLVLIFIYLAICLSFVFLLEIDDIGTSENAFKFDDKQCNTFISFFLLLQSDFLYGEISRETFSFQLKVRVFYRFQDDICVSKSFERFFGDFSLVNW